MMIIRIALFLSLLIGVSGCYDEQKETPTKGSMILAVDETVAPVIQLITKDFERLYPEAKIQVKVETAREAIADLLNEKLSCIITAREFNKEEKEVINKFSLNIITHKIAYDGIAIITNIQNPVKQIDLQQIKKIFTGEVENWNGISKTYAGPIQIFGENQNYSGYEYLKENVLNGKKFADFIYPCSTSTHVINMVAKVPNSIGWVGISYKPKDNKNIRVLEVAAYDSSSIVQNYFEPAQAHIYRKYYPLTRQIYLFYRNEGMNLVSGFTAFITHEGQRFFRDNGLIPATAPVRLININ